MADAAINLHVVSDSTAIDRIMTKINKTAAAMGQVNLVAQRLNTTVKYVANEQGKLEEHVKNTVTNTYDLDGVMKTVKSTSSYISEDFANIVDKCDLEKQKISEANLMLEKQSRIADKIGMAVMSIGAGFLSMKGIKDLMKLSDQMTLSEGKIGLYADPESGWDVQTIKDAIYEVSQSSRSNYTSMLAQISKMAINTGGVGAENSVFGTYTELMKFNEVLNQTFVIGGTGFREMNAAMYQLTQSLSSGRLQGDEFRSLIENAPYFARTVLDYVNTMNNTGIDGGAMQDTSEYLNVTLAQLRDLGAEGVITSEVLVNAMIWAADDVNAKFKSIPLTWEQSMAMFKNSMVRAFDPLLNVIQNVVNSAQVKSILSSIGNMVSAVMPVLSAVFGIITTIGSYVAAQWQILLPIVTALGVAYMIEAGELKKGIMAKVYDTTVTILNTTAKAINRVAIWAATAATKTNTLITSINNRTLLANVLTHRKWNIMAKLKALWTTIGTMRTNVNTASLWANVGAESATTVSKGAATVATMLLTGATAVFNAVLMANPLVWIILLFAAFVAIMFVVMKAMGKLGNAAGSIFGAIAGAVMALGAIFYDVFAGIYNGIAWIVNGVGSIFGHGDIMKAVEYKDPTKIYAEYYNKAAGSQEEYDVEKPSVTEGLSPELQAALDGLKGDTGDIKDNTSLNIDLMRELAGVSYISRFGEGITNNITLQTTISKEADIDNVVDKLTARLITSIDTTAGGYHGA